MTEKKSEIIIFTHPSLFHEAPQPTINSDTNTLQTFISSSQPLNQIPESRRHEQIISNENETTNKPVDLTLPLARRNSIQNKDNSNNQNSPVQQGLFVFRQESLRGNRLVPIPSLQEVPGQQRTIEPLRLPSEPDEISIPIDNSEHLEDIPHNYIEMNRQAQLENDLLINDHSEEENIRKGAIHRVIIQFMVNLTLLIAYSLVYLFILGQVSLMTLFEVFNALAVVYILVIIATKDFSDRLDFFSFFLSISHTIALMMYVTAAFLKMKAYEIPLIPFSLIGFIFVVASWCKYSMEPPTGARFMLISLKIILWSELLMVGLYFDGGSLHWNTVFAPLYLALMIFAFSSVLIAISTLTAFCSIAQEAGFSFRLLFGTIWYLLNAFYAVVWIYLITMVVEYLENGGGDIDASLKTGIVHSGLLFVYTLVFWRPLCKFQQFEIQSEMLAAGENNQEEGEEGEEEPETRQRISFKTFKDHRTNLTMISPTFYAFLTKHFRHKDKKEVEKLKNEAQNAKLKKIHHKLKRTTPYRSADPTPNNKPLYSTPKPVPKHNLDFSDGDIDMDKILLPTLKKEESTKANENLCVICFDNPPNAVFMDCGHGGVCYECALELWKKSDDCMLCRKKIDRVLKIANLKSLKMIKVIESTKKVIENVSS